LLFFAHQLAVPPTHAGKGACSKRRKSRMKMKMKMKIRIRKRIKSKRKSMIKIVFR